MCRARPSLLALGAVLLVAVSCGDPGGPLARVGGRPIPVEALQGYLEEVTGERWQTLDGRVASRLLDQLLDQEVVLTASGRGGGEGAALPAGPRAGLVQRLVVDACGEAPPVDPATLAAEVERRAVGAEREPGVHLRQMLLDDEASAREICRRLEQGGDWALLSREVSRAPNAAGGGEVGLVRRGSLPEELEEVVFALSPGEVSEPVQGPSGFHVFQALEVDPGGPVELEEIAEEVRRDLGAAAARTHLRACLDRLATEVGVTVDTRLLWFRYDGRYAEESHVP